MLEVLLAVLAVAPTQVEGFPLDKGLRWTYEYGRHWTATVDVVGTKTIGGKEVTVLTVVGKWLFSHRGGDFYVNSKDGGFAVHGSHFERYDDPLLFVQPGLETGATWHSETLGHTKYRDRRMAFNAVVLGRETVTVPAGEFDAWKVAVDNEQGVPHAARSDFTAWFVPGVGFVKYEYRYNLYPSPGFLEPYIVYQLKEFGKLPNGYPIEYPELSDQQQDEAERLLTSLGTDEPEAYRAAQEDLVALGPGVVPVLLEYLQREEDAHRQGRIKKLLQEFARIELTASTTQPKGYVGEPAPLDFRIRNVGCAPIPVLQALSLGDYRWRYPTYTIEVRDPLGRILNVKPPSGCVFPAYIQEPCFTILQPGEAWNPLPSAYFRDMFQWWKPKKPGTYTIRCIYEGGGIDHAENEHSHSPWFRPPTPTLVNMFNRTPRGRVVSNEVSLTVEE